MIFFLCSWWHSMYCSHSNCWIHRMCMCMYASTYVMVIVSLNTIHHLLFVMQIHYFFICCRKLTFYYCEEWLCSAKYYFITISFKKNEACECVTVVTCLLFFFTGSSDCWCCWQYCQLTSTRNCTSCWALRRIASKVRCKFTCCTMWMWFACVNHWGNRDAVFNDKVTDLT